MVHQFLQSFWSMRRSGLFNNSLFYDFKNQMLQEPPLTYLFKQEILLKRINRQESGHQRATTHYTISPACHYETKAINFATSLVVNYGHRKNSAVTWGSLFACIPHWHFAETATSQFGLQWFDKCTELAHTRIVRKLPFLEPIILWSVFRTVRTNIFSKIQRHSGGCCSSPTCIEIWN